MSFWNAVVESNTFNFAVLLLIFIVLFNKLKINQVIDNLKSSIILTINNAKKEKEAAELKLKEAKDLAGNIEQEIQTQTNNANEKATAIETQIIENAKNQEEYIDKNISKLIFAEEKSIGNDAIMNTIKKASELAVEKIKLSLDSNPELHKQFIEESIRKI